MSKQIDWKLLFQQLFALEIKKEFVLCLPPEQQEAAFHRLLNAFVQYSPRSFNELVEEASAAASSEQARQVRVDFYEHPLSRLLVSSLALEHCIPAALREHAAIDAFLCSIEASQSRSVDSQENFFASPEGDQVMHAFAADGAAGTQEVALVMVPGYAAHTIEFSIFDEMVGDANEHQGRPRTRPLLNSDGFELEFEGHVSFYKRGSAKGGFDVLHPAGKELGNTTGHNEETSDAMYAWLKQLPQRYRNTKFILLGYSKGAPIVLDMVRRHPDLEERILGYVTHAGVMQGTHVARLLLERLKAVLKDVSIATFVDRLRDEDPQTFARLLSPLFYEVELSWLSVPRIRAVFEMLGYDTQKHEERISRALDGREVRELLDGGVAMAPLACVRKCLLNFSNDTFAKSTYIYHLSAITDIQDFIEPVEPERAGHKGPSLVAPTLTEAGKIDWEHLSIDALFLYFSSLDGFNSAPGGLYDTQVELPNTKALHLDTRPLAASLTEDEIQQLWDDPEVATVLSANEVQSKAEFSQNPRSELIKATNRSNVDAIDLGEFRGHHWSLFEQAIRPPSDVSEQYAKWKFPRKAYMRALIQVLALRNLVDAQKMESKA